MNGGWSVWGNASLVVTTTSARVLLPPTLSENVDTNHGKSALRQMRTARISFPAGTLVAATDLVFIKFGDITVAAVVASDLALLPNWVHHLEVPIEATYLAAISSANGTTMRISLGRAVIT